jgi:hypothetical protein
MHDPAAARLARGTVGTSWQLRTADTQSAAKLTGGPLLVAFESFSSAEGIFL